MAGNSSQVGPEDILTQKSDGKRMKKHHDCVLVWSGSHSRLVVIERQ